MITAKDISELRGRTGVGMMIARKRLWRAMAISTRR